MLFLSRTALRRIRRPSPSICIACSYSTSPTPSVRPLKLAIIGAGPSGFYTASRILHSLPATSEHGQNVEVHMYDRLPTPYGLVRYGVAPDHPEVKNCQHKFDELASDPRFKFYGNVYIGSPPDNDIWHSYSYPQALHIPISSLFPYYNNILLTYGASTSNPLPTTKGSSYSPQPAGNVLPALAFVSWYNGHPAYAHLRPKFENVTDATIIGHGNVAIDCARIMLKSPEALAGTDIPESVLEVLRSNRVRHVQAVGRRGPAQVAFTTKEFREMLNLDGVEYAGIDKALMDDAKSMVEQQGDRARKRLLGLMDKGVDRSKISPSNKVFELGFLKSPMAFLPDSSTGHVSRIRWSINSLLAPPAPPPSPAPSPPTTPAVSSNTNLSAAVVARPTGEEIETLSGLVIESVGYRSENVARNDGWSLPFDQRRGRVVNDGGRVVDESGVMIPGLYAAGWVARGPVGVIASTMQNAYSIASLIISDHISEGDSSGHASTAVLAAIPEAGIPPEVERSQQRIVTLADWRRIDEEEQRRGKPLGKPREKFTTVESMLQVLD